MNAPALFRQQLLAAIPRLRRYARSVVFNPDAADDLVQIALERALSHWQQFDQGRDMLVWAISIAHNAHVDERRRNARMNIVEPPDNGAAPHAHLDAAGGDPGTDIGLRLDLLGALQRLPAHQREALLLVSVEQLSYAECATALSVPIGTVMSRVSRGRSALRELLDGPAPKSAPFGAPLLRRVI